MAKSSKYTSRITSLEHELGTVRHELALLQSSRSHRTAKLMRQLASSSPAEVPKILKQFPDLLKRYSIPEPEKKQDQVDLFNPLTNSLPLHKYPNINIALVSNGKSRYNTLFTETCNAMPLNSTHANELIKYGALQLLLVDIEYYQKERDLALINLAMDGGARLILASHRAGSIPQELSEYNPVEIVAGIDRGSTIQPFADIYSITQRVVPRMIDNQVQPIATISDVSAINNISHSNISVLSKELISEIDYESACRILDKIASYCPVIIEGKKPSWVPDNVRSFTSEDQLKQIIHELNQPYVAERYSIDCGRKTVVEFNSLVVVSRLLFDLGLIEKLPKNPKISIILSMRRPQFLRQIMDQLSKQTLRPHEIILMLHGIPEEDKDRVEKFIASADIPIKHEYVSESVLFGDVLNKAIDKAEGEFATKVDDDDYYLPNHLLDLYAAHLSSRADFVGKWNHWVYIQADDATISWSPENANMYVRHIPGGTLFGKTTTFREAKFGKVRRAIDSELYRRAEKRGAVLYSTHKYNYVRVRHDDHTYTASNADFKSRSDGNTLSGLPIDDMLAS